MGVRCLKCESADIATETLEEGVHKYTRHHCRKCGARFGFRSKRNPNGHPVVYSFRTRVRCPDCASIDTYKIKTLGRIRHMECRNPKCGRRFKEIGEPMEVPYGEEDHGEAGQA